MSDNRPTTIQALLGVALSALLLFLLYLYAFVWQNTPHLGRIFGFDA